MSGFILHPRLVEDCHILGRLGTSHLLLHRNAAVPWFILVPRTGLAELFELDAAARRALMEETDILAGFVKRHFDVAKINVAAIGNLVPQLHVHVVGRSPGDPCWPRPVWGHLDTVASWPPERLAEIAAALAERTPFRSGAGTSVVAAAGVDGCRGGWFAVLDDDGLRWRVLPSFAEVLAWLPAQCAVAVDIPIGLPETGSRACDVEVRRQLGARGSTVFPAPIRPVLDAADYRDACERCHRVDGRRMSRQAWNLVPKIREVDEELRQRPDLAGRIAEVHPELSLAELAGGVPMSRPKRDSQGRAERLGLLAEVFGSAPAEALAWRRGRACAPDDVLDAFAALWSARRLRSGQALGIPDPPETDARGLPMCIRA